MDNLQQVLMVAVSALTLFAATADTQVDGVIFASNAAPAATFPTGETLVTARAGASSSVGGVQLANNNQYYAAAQDGAVIKLQLASGATRADVNFGLKIDTGTVTLDMTEIGNVPFKFGGTLWVGDAATLVIKGRDAIDFGWAVTSDSFLPAGIRAGSITFVDANNQPYAGPAIHFTGAFTEIRIPGNVSWDIAAGTMAIIHKSVASGIVSRFATGEGPVKTMVLDTFDVTMLDPAGVQNLAFRVDSGRQLRVMPRTPKYEYGYALNANSLNCTFDNDITFNHDNATADLPELLFYYHHTTAFAGDVGGHGRIKYSTAFSQGDGELTTLSGALGFSGEFVVECTAGSPVARVMVKQATPGADGVNVALGAGCELQLNPDSDVSGVIGGLSGTATSSLKIAQHATVTFMSAPQGGVAIVGLGSWVPTVYRGWNLQSGDYFLDEDDGSCIWRLTPAVAAAARHMDWSSSCHVYFQPTAIDGVLYIPEMELPASRGPLALEAVNGEKYANVPNGAKILAKAGVSAAVVVNDNDSVSLEAEAGAALATERTPAFDYGKVAELWFDASSETSYTHYAASATSMDYWYDCRGEREDLFLRNDKYWIALADTIAPVTVAQGLNGLTYAAMSTGNRRIGFWTAQAVTDRDAGTREVWNYTCSDFRPRYCIMVFGSQAGGGCALLASSDEYFIRNGKPTDKASVTKDTFIFDNDIPVYVDGEAKPGQSTGLSGGWQILSFPTYGKQVVGLASSGNLGNYLTSGNANYAEILFFDRELNEVERVTVERYLATKWGLTGTYHDSGVGKRPVTVDARGAGTITLGTKTVIAPGSFGGTLNANGQDVSFATATFPPTSNVVDAVASPSCWFDPTLDDMDHITLNPGLTYGKALGAIYDVRYGKTAGTSYLNAAGRSPLIVKSMDEHNWLDFSPSLHPGTTASGRALRFNVAESGEPSTTIDGGPEAKTIILVQDSSKTGGTPFMDTVNGSSTLSQRNPSYDTYGAITADKPILTGTSAQTLASAQTYLNGATVDGKTVGFLGEPEILTVANATAFRPWVFGNLYHLNGHTPNDVDAGERLGEVVIYNEVLSSEQRRDVEAYLAWKWCGRAINGYACHTNLTLTGSGAVVVGDVGQMPKFDSSFSGTVILPNAESLYFSVSRGTTDVAGALALAGAAEFPSEVTVNVTYSGRPKSGEYTLISAGSGLDNSTWNLTEVPGIQAKLVVTPAAVKLVIPVPGMIISFH